MNLYYNTIADFIRDIGVAVENNLIWPFYPIFHGNWVDFRLHLPNYMRRMLSLF